MKEGLLNDDTLKQSYLNLKKFSDQVKKDYTKFMKEDFGSAEWKREGRKIENNLKKYEKSLKEVQRNLKNAKGNGSLNEENVSTVEDGLEKIKEIVEPMARTMREKIDQFNQDMEMDDQGNPEENEDELDKEQEQIQVDLMNNKEYLEQRGKELKEIHKTAAIIKDTTDKMAQDLNKQGEILDDVEAKVIKVEENVEKGAKEIKKADELSRGNTKRLSCIIFIVVVAIGVILAIVLSLVFR